MPRANHERPIHLDQPSVLIEDSQPPAPPPPLSLPYLPKQPDIRCPYDISHNEGYLLRCLIRHYGWTWLDAGVLRRPGA